MNQVQIIQEILQAEQAWAQALLNLDLSTIDQLMRRNTQLFSRAVW